MTDADLIRYAADNFLWDGYSDSVLSAFPGHAILVAARSLNQSAYTAMQAIDHFIGDQSIFHGQVGEERQNFRYMVMNFVADMLDEGEL